ncbi:MAG: hypothetical protein IE885_08275 [Campylobacterales bacterium]|nr:hypothetical protein [Campylobacterales bacterium]
MIVYGTKIKSDIAFPLVLPDDVQFKYEVSLSSQVPDHLKRSIRCGFPLYFAHGRSVYFYSDRLFDGSDRGQPWCYEVKDVVRFYWRGGEESIYYEMDEKGDAALLSFWFIHLLLPLYLSLEEKYDFFHAGAVEVEGSPILFIAPSMGGKSTLTDFFIKKGHTLVSDDKVATFIEEDRFMAVGAHPYHRPYRKFEDLGYLVEDFSRVFQPIQAFYLLDKTEPDAEITISEIKGFEKFESLLPNYLYMFSFLKAKRLRYLSLMMNVIKVFRVNIPWDRNRLEEVHDAIVKHSQKIGS